MSRSCTGIVITFKTQMTLYLIVLSISTIFSTSLAVLNQKDIINLPVQVLTLKKLLWGEVHHAIAHPSNDNSTQISALKNIIEYNNVFIRVIDKLYHHNSSKDRFPKLNHIPDWVRLEYEFIIVSNNFEQFRKFIAQYSETDLKDFQKYIKDFANKILSKFFFDFVEFFDRLMEFIGYDCEINFYEIIKKVGECYKN